MHVRLWSFGDNLFEPGHSISYKIACTSSEGSDQPTHPRSRISVFADSLKTLWILGNTQRAQWRLWSVCADAQTDLSLHWADLSLQWPHMQPCMKCCVLAHLSFSNMVKEAVLDAGPQ